MLNQDKIRRNLISKKTVVEIFESINSTNEYLQQFYGTECEQPRFCLTEHQSKGRGRFDRSWYSPYAQNIYLSCFYSFTKDISELAGLSLVVSLAVVKSIKDCFMLNDLAVKWPNDIICQDKKLAGILTEIQPQEPGSSDVIIGMGINVNLLHDQNHDISTQWTSLREVLNKYIDRNQLCVSLINNLLSYLDIFIAKGFVAFLDEWQQIDYLATKNITLKIAQHIIHGQVQGINQHGHILLRLQDGKIQAFSSGEATVITKL